MISPVQLIGGAFQDSQGNVLNSGYLTMMLSQDGETNDSLICAGITLTVQLDSNGNVASTSSTPAVSNQYVWGNDQLLPVNSYYTVTGFTAAGQIAFGPNNQQVVGNGGTFDVGQWVPNQVISWVNPNTVIRSGAIQYTIDGGGSVPSTGAKGQLYIPLALTITGWTLTGDQSGSAVVDVLTCPYLSFPSGLASIAGTDKPSFSSSQSGQDLVLTGWGNIDVSAGTEMQFYLDSVAHCTRLNLTLNVTLTG